MKAFLQYGFLLTLCWMGVLQAETREIPYLSGPVLDEANILSASEESNLGQMIRSLKDQIQFQIWTVQDLQGESIEELSIRAVDKWKLGTAKQDNGILILVAVNDRQIRIEVGQGLEGSIPDVMAARIIDYQMVPRFRSQRFYDAFRAAIESLASLAGGKVPPQLDERQLSKDADLIWIIFVILFFGFAVAMRIFGALFGIRMNRGRGWSSGGWSGGGSFGGGWSGGGGGFSGGGATGRW